MRDWCNGNITGFQPVAKSSILLLRTMNIVIGLLVAALLVGSLLVWSLAGYKNLGVGQKVVNKYSRKRGVIIDVFYDHDFVCDTVYKVQVDKLTEVWTIDETMPT